MILSKKNIDLVQEVIFKNNIDLSKGNDLFLSYIEKNLFCMYSKKTNIGNFFCDSSPEKMNIFFKKLAIMLLSDELNGDGCFDYENNKLSIEYSTKEKINKYFSTENNFVLITISKNTIIPLSFFSLDRGFIWNLCSDKNNRNKGYMSKLFKHFLKLIKDKDLQLNLNSPEDLDKIELYLLKSNPSFDKSKQFYFENGFKIKNDLDDRLVLIYLI